MSNLDASQKHSAQELEKWKKELLAQAMEVRGKAYAPYSNFFVGAAVLTESGETFTGVNVENASYGMTICAERSALVSAVSQGHRKIQALALVLKDGGCPCGACRQFMNEFNPEMLVITSNEEGTEIIEYTLSELLPDSFGPQNLL